MSQLPSPIPASLANLHRRTDTEGLLPLLPLLMEFPAGFTAAVLIQTAQERSIFPGMDEVQLAWKIRRSINIFEKVGYLKNTVHGWHIPDVVRIKGECEAAAREINRVIAEMSTQRNSLLQAAFMGSGSAPAHASTRTKKPPFKAGPGLEKLASKTKKK